jgi:TetR/AcrR family transcriptional regulator, cholesterol catabolism regulator
MIAKQREKIESILESSPDVISAIFTIIRTSRDHAATMNPLINADLKKYHSKVMKRLKEKCGHPDHEAGVKILEKGDQQGIFRETFNTDILSRAFRGIAAMTGDEELFPSEMFERREIMQNVMVSFMRGISTPRGVQLIDSMENEI